MHHTGIHLLRSEQISRYIYDQLEEIPDIYLLTPIYVLLVRPQSQLMVTQSTFYAHLCASLIIINAPVYNTQLF